jgi:hypothetical protein
VSSKRPEPGSDLPAGPDRVKAALGRLAGADSRVVVERADAATEDVEAAAEFVESVGLTELQLAVQRADSPEVRERGERALAAFRRFQAAATGDSGLDNASGADAESGDTKPDTSTSGASEAAVSELDDRTLADHFHRGRGTDLRDGVEGSTE